MNDIAISRVKGGGFVLRDIKPYEHNDELNRLSGPLLACSTLDEALAFIRSRMEPEGEVEKDLREARRWQQEKAWKGRMNVWPTPPRHGDFGSRPEEDGA